MDIRQIVDEGAVEHHRHEAAGDVAAGGEEEVGRRQTPAQQQATASAAAEGDRHASDAHGAAARDATAHAGSSAAAGASEAAAAEAVSTSLHGQEGAGLQQGSSSSQPPPSDASIPGAPPQQHATITSSAQPTQDGSHPSGSGPEMTSSSSVVDDDHQYQHQHDDQHEHQQSHHEQPQEDDDDDDHQQPVIHDSDSASIGAPSSFSLGLSVDTDEAGSDADSAIGSVRAQSSSMSASSSIFDFVEAHGRTWHRYHEGKYFMPNDIPEQERLDLQHSISVRLFGGLYLAPVERPGRVLDIGTGTGIWAIEFANEHPESDVLGTDLSPIQPEYVPPNCRFEVDDAEDEWVFNHRFDFIHSRFMSGSISSFPDLFATCMDNLNPGGWVELQDYYVRLQAVDGSLVGSTLERWNECVIEGVKRMGKNALACAKYKTQLQDAGFVDVVEKKFALPGNPWAKGDDQKMLGTMQMENILDGLHGFSIGLFTKMLGMSVEEVELMLVDVRKDLRNTKIHFYYVVYSVYGRKPF